MSIYLVFYTIPAKDPYNDPVRKVRKVSYEALSAKIEALLERGCTIDRITKA